VKRKTMHSKVLHNFITQLVMGPSGGVGCGCGASAKRPQATCTKKGVSFHLGKNA